jgi:glycosyltransferase involved in cell wall biosynthesis
MKISFILSSLWLSGGVRVVVQYANRLSKRGHRINLIIPKGTIDAELFPEIDSEVKIIQTKHVLESKTNLFHLMLLSLEMASIVPRSDIIIATHTPTTIVSFIAGKLLKRGKIVWFYLDYKEMFDGRPIEGWLMRHALPWHAYALTISDACLEELHSYSQGKVFNVGLGLDTVNIFHPIPGARGEYHGEKTNKILLFLGDSRPRKGMADFLLAAEIVFRLEPNLYLWIVSKETSVLTAKVPNKFITRPDDKKLACLYSACDVFVSASWYEGFGLPPLEAMACGAAVVTTNSRGVLEFAVDGQNCLMVPPKDPDALAKAILRLLSDENLADLLRKNGPGTTAMFDWERATDRFETVLLKSIS